MPTSHPESRDWVREQFVSLAPRRILDVGAGSGTYSDLLRGAGEHWIGLEVWGPYLAKYHLAEKYDEIITQDLRYAPLPNVDLAIVGDCIEHVTLAEGERFIERLKPHAHAVILVVPLGEYPQGAVEGNPFEAHVATWTHEDALRVVEPFDYFVGEVVGAYLWRRDE